MVNVVELFCLCGVGGVGSLTPGGGLISVRGAKTALRRYPSWEFKGFSQCAEFWRDCLG